MATAGVDRRAGLTRLQVALEELEEETCGFCKFMKAGPCGTVFKVGCACAVIPPCFLIPP